MKITFGRSRFRWYKFFGIMVHYDHRPVMKDHPHVGSCISHHEAYIVARSFEIDRWGYHFAIKWKVNDIKCS